MNEYLKIIYIVYNIVFCTQKIKKQDKGHSVCDYTFVNGTFSEYCLVPIKL